MIPEQYTQYTEKYDKRAKLRKEVLNLNNQIHSLSMQLHVESEHLATTIGLLTMDSKLCNRIGQLLECEDIQTDIITNEDKNRVIVRKYKFVNIITKREYWITEDRIIKNNKWTIVDKSTPTLGKSMKFTRVIFVGKDEDGNRNLYIGIGTKIGVLFAAYMSDMFNTNMECNLKYTDRYDNYYLMMKHIITEKTPVWRHKLKNIRVAEKVIIKKLITDRAEMTSYLL